LWSEFATELKVQCPSANLAEIDYYSCMKAKTDKISDADVVKVLAKKFDEWAKTSPDKARFKSTGKDIFKIVASIKSASISQRSDWVTLRIKQGRVPVGKVDGKDNVKPFVIDLNPDISAQSHFSVVKNSGLTGKTFGIFSCNVPMNGQFIYDLFDWFDLNWTVPSTWTQSDERTDCASGKNKIFIAHPGRSSEPQPWGLLSITLDSDQLKADKQVFDEMVKSIIDKYGYSWYCI